MTSVKNTEFYTKYRKMPNWKGYYISIDGEVYSTKNNKVLKPRMTRDGYVRYFLYSEKVNRHVFAHRLVTQVYNPEKYNEKLQVNHIDGNKLNNHASNLEMCSASENILHAFKIGLKKPTKRLGREVECNTCGKLVYKKLYILKKRSSYYCSHSCVGKRKRG